MSKYSSEREEKLLEDLITLTIAIKDTDGIKKIDEAIALVAGTSVNIGNFPSTYPLPSAQVTDLKDISDRSARELGKATIKDIEKVADVTKYLSPTALGAGGTATIWTPASGQKVRFKRVQVSVNAVTRIDLRWGTTAFESYYLPANGSIIFNAIGVNEEGAVDTALTLLSSAAATVTASAKGDEV